MRKLVLFFDLYCSMTKYDGEGLLTRDLLLYERLLERNAFDEIQIFTYDDRDKEKLVELQNTRGVSRRISVLTPPRSMKGTLGAILYSIVGPLMHWRQISSASVLKTHQVSGSWTAAVAKVVFRKPLVFRLGYPLSVRFSSEEKSIKRAITRALEAGMIRLADRTAVASRTMQKYYSALGGGRRVDLLPNYVDVSGFTPKESYDKSDPILYVGRLEAVKNVANLIVACSSIGVPLVGYGGGSMQAELEEVAASCDGDARFRGFVPNDELKRVHHEHSICVLCSTREGMPKSLVEAMASGLICLTTRTDGGLELIEHGRTGYVIDGFDAAAIERQLRKTLSEFDPAIGRNAARHMREFYALERCLDLEIALLAELFAKAPSPEAAIGSHSGDASLPPAA